MTILISIERFERRFAKRESLSRSVPSYSRARAHVRLASSRAIRRMRLKKVVFTLEDRLCDLALNEKGETGAFLDKAGSFLHRELLAPAGIGQRVCGRRQGCERETI